MRRAWAAQEREGTQAVHSTKNILGSAQVMQPFGGGPKRRIYDMVDDVLRIHNRSCSANAILYHVM